MPLARSRKLRAAPAAMLHSIDASERRLAVADCTDAEVLFAQLQRECDVGVRHAIFTRLGSLADTEVAERLVSFLGSEEVAQRNDAILALRRCGVSAVPALRGALRSPDPDVRIFGANALEGIPAPSSRALLIDLLAQEGDANVCLAAVEALAQIGTSADVPSLTALRDRFPGEPGLGFAVALALDTIGEGM
ncbi:HEAT repeat domain-containing protein [Sediminicoccus sp. BL-A-41-H5]|uniref:HEAT repeat domain-containing protein n=1 Tax=Sediminicoccus sp. BL-A-41-H5 TaxID=3421106 RepID=UPI003D671808